MPPRKPFDSRSDARVDPPSSPPPRAIVMQRPPEVVRHATDAPANALGLVVLQKIATLEAEKLLVRERLDKLERLEENSKIIAIRADIAEKARAAAGDQAAADAISKRQQDAALALEERKAELVTRQQREQRLWAAVVALAAALLGAVAKLVFGG